MRILLAPFIDRPDDSPSYLLAQSLIDTFTSADHVCGISIPRTSSVHNAEIFSCPLPKTPLFHQTPSTATGHTYEDFQGTAGCLTSSYLEKDVRTLLDAIDSFKPDRIIEIGRLAATMAARIRHVPYDSILSPAIYRDHAISSRVLSGVNRTLHNNHLEQILRLSDLSNHAEHRYAFGSPTLQLFPEETEVQILGCSAIPFENTPTTTNVVVCLRDTNFTPRQLRRFLEECFLGASYKVSLYVPHTRTGTVKNMLWLSSMKLNTIPGASIVIHDGNEFLSNYCMMLGIPQLVIADSSCMRSWTAFNVSRSGIGISLSEKEVSVASLYEAYRRIITDDYYRRRTGMFRQEITSMDGIEYLTR